MLCIINAEVSSGLLLRVTFAVLLDAGWAVGLCLQS